MCVCVFVWGGCTLLVLYPYRVLKDAFEVLKEGPLNSLFTRLPVLLLLLFTNTVSGGALQTDCLSFPQSVRPPLQSRVKYLTKIGWTAVKFYTEICGTFTGRTGTTF